MSETRTRGGQRVYDADVAEEVCRRMEMGESLKSIARSPGMPPESTVRNWAHDDVDGFAARYARAREHQTEALLDDCRDIIENPDVDPQRARLIWDARRWHASKIMRNVYGDTQKHTHSGPNDGPIPIAAVTIDAADLSEDERSAVRAALRGKK